MPSRRDGVDRLAVDLLQRLRGGLGSPDLTYRRPPKCLAGGKFSSVYAFELHPQPEGWTGSCVLRLVGSSELARLEAGLHVAAIAEGFSAPRLLFWDADAPGISGGYLVMERIPGRTYLRGVEPWRFALDLPKLFAAWPSQLAKVIGALALVEGTSLGVV